MKPTKRQVLRKSLSISLAAFTFVALLTSTFAWFKEGIDISFSGIGSSANVVGGIEKQYFGGDSSNPNWGHDEDYPYLIQNKEHLYNLAWLQYLGYFNTQLDGNNRPSTTPNIQQLYFKLDVQGGVLDMEEMVLPPIGTETYPFYSHFDGNNQTIKNLIVSNDDPNNANSVFGVHKPQNINTNYPNAHQPRVVGFFGAVGYISTCDAPNINAQTCSSYVASIEDVTLQDITIQNGTNLASGIDSGLLIGLAAGYVGECNMSGVKVSGTKSALKINGTKTAIASSITQKLSDYGLVGYSKKTGKIGTFSQELSKYYANDDPTHGGISWGGSISMKACNMFIYRHFLQNPDATLETSLISTSSSTLNSRANATNGYDIEMFYSTFPSSPHRITTNNGSAYTYYMAPDSFNINPLKTITNPPNTTNVLSSSRNGLIFNFTDGGYIPLKFTETDEKKWEHVSPNNTGYIVGKNNSVLMTSVYQKKIGNSTEESAVSYSASGGIYDKFYDASTTMEIVTYSTVKGKWCLVKDTYNASHTTIGNTRLSELKNDKYTATELNLNRYADARDEFQTSLLSDKRLNGIQFVGSTPDGTKPSMLSLSQGLSVLGKTNADYSSSYQLPKGYIDFNLMEKGHITLFAGTYNANTQPTTMTFFSIYKVNRNQSTGEISSMSRISEVYQDSSNANAYVYKFSDGSFSSSNHGNTPLFNLTTTLEADFPMNSGNSSRNNMVFYFEIPVNEGEYAIGMVPGKASGVSGANLLYLDVGSNGSNAEKKKMAAYRITSTDSGNTFPTGVDFATVGTSTNKDGGQSFCLSIPSSQTGSMTFNVSTNTVGITTSITGKYSYKSSRYVASSPNNSQFTITGISYSDEFIVQTEKTQVTYICAPDSGGTKHLILITEVLQPTQSTTYTLDGTSKTKAQLQTAIPLLTDDAISTIDTVVSNNAFTAARDNTGTIATLDCVLPKTVSGSNKDFPWADGDVYNVTIDPYASGLKINITRVVTTCSMKINGNSIAFTNNAASYPAS